MEVALIVLAVVAVLVFRSWGKSKDQENAYRRDLRWFEYERTHPDGDRGTRWRIDLHEMRMTQESFDDEGEETDEFPVRRTKAGRWQAKSFGNWQALDDTMTPQLEGQYQRFLRHHREYD